MKSIGWPPLTANEAKLGYCRGAKGENCRSMRKLPKFAIRIP